MRLLDTDIMVDIQRGYEPALTWLESLEEAPGLPGFVVMELMEGCRDKQEMNGLRKQLEPFSVCWPSDVDSNQALLTFSQGRLSHNLGVLDALIGGREIEISITTGKYQFEGPYDKTVARNDSHNNISDNFILSRPCRKRHRQGGRPMSGKRKLPKGWRLVPLTEGGLVEVDPKTDAPKDWDRDRMVSFLPMALVDEATGTARDFEHKSLASCSGGKSRFRNTDVLFAKITPCVQNGKIALIENLPESIGFGSTEFYVLRSGERLLPEYLWYFVRTSNVIERAVATFTGTSGRQRVPSTFWDDLEIPLPPLAVQERIVEVLRQADMIRRKRAEARRLADQILPALFLDMFGDPATNPKTWPVKKIGECTTLVTSGYTPRGGAQNYTNEGPLLIRSQNVRMLSLDLSDCAHLPTDVFDAMARVRVFPNDVLLNITGASIGRTAFANEDIPPAVVNQHVCIIRLHKDTLAAEFLSYLLSMNLYQHIIQNSPGSAQSGFNHQRVRDLNIPVPPISLQRSFGAHISYIQENFSGFAATDSTSDSLYSVLLSRAFTGELTAEWEAANADWIAERQTFYERLPRLALLSLLLEQRQRAGREAVTLITALMKYAFLAQMEGDLRRRFYRFIPYHYGPCAMELYDDLKALEADGLIAVKDDKDEDKTRITLIDPGRAADLLEEEARKDDARLAALEPPGETEDVKTDPATMRLLQRRAETIEILRADAAAILDTYGNLDHKRLLETVYEKYPAYAKNSRIRWKRKPRVNP